jgi:glycosyltransferase involved in cell wall biosynthesis
VLVVGPMPPTKGGVTTFMLNLMGSALADQFEFVPFTTSRPPKKATLDNWGYAAMFRGGVGRVLQGVGVTLWHMLLFPFVVVGRRVDLIQIQASDYQAFWESVFYVLVGRALGRRVSLRIGGAFDQFHAGSPAVVKRLIGSALRVPHLLVAQSEFACAYIEGAGRQGPIVVLPNWARADRVDYAERPSRPECVFLFIAGSDAIRKGLEPVLEAAQRLEAQGRQDIRIHLVAAPDMLIERIDREGPRLVSRVEGFLPNDRVIEAMRAADVLLLPSFGEGFPNTLVEAMACGLPAIATPVGAVPEIVADGGAELVPVKDAEALAAAMVRLADDPSLRERHGRQAFTTVRQRYVAGAVLPPLAAAYEALCQGR